VKFEAGTPPAAHSFRLTLGDLCTQENHQLNLIEKSIYLNFHDE
jgi:hypothetical protein